MASLRSHLVVASMLVLSAQVGRAAAQTPAPAPAQDDELPPRPPAAGGTCTPACREGYSCHEGTCISACNPPCGPGERCTAAGACIAPTAEAPSFPVPPDMESPDNAPPEPIFNRGVEQHDGFMLRLTIGPGGGGAFLDASADPQGVWPGKVEFSGGGAGFSFDIGGSLTDDLVLTFRISQFDMIDPKVEVAGFSDTVEGSFGGDFVGLALTYYFMPINLYLTGAPGLGRIRIDQDNDREDTRGTDFGFGLNFDLGKEWWVSDNWGLGIAGRFMWLSGEDDANYDVTLDFGLASFALLFSATYQ